MKVRTNARPIASSNYTPVIASARGRNSNEALANAAGEINAGNTNELLSRILEIASRVQTGEFDNGAAEVASVASPAERNQILRDAIADKSGRAWMELANGIAAEITDTVARQGFMRQFLVRGDVAQGSIPRIRVRHRNALAVAATGPSVVAAQSIRDSYLYPAEFSVIARPTVEDREMHQGSGDLLAEKHMEALEHIMVVEDRTFLNLIDQAAPLYNTTQLWSGGLTPAVISAAQYQVSSWSVPVSTMLMSIDLLQDMQSGAGFTSGNSGGFFDPVSRLEIIMTGRLGTLLGMQLMTDGFRNSRLRVLNSGTFYIMTDPTLLGAYTDRGPVESEPVTPGMTGSTQRGFFMKELISQAVGNAYGVAAARRT